MGNEENNGENNGLDEMEAKRQNNLALKSGKEAFKKQAKKNRRKEVVKAIIKVIVANVLHILMYLLPFILLIVLIASFMNILGGDGSDDLLNDDDMNSSGATMSLTEYLRQFPHPDGSPAPQSEDGKFYKMYGDGAGYPTIGNADLQWKSQQNHFACQGKVLKPDGEYTVENVQEYINSVLPRGGSAKYNNLEIDALNIYIEKELVDKIGEEVAEEFYNYVLTQTEGLNLSQQQLYALTKVSYSGNFIKWNGYTFKEVYEQATALYEINSWEHNRYVWDNWFAFVKINLPGHLKGRDAAFETYVKGIYDLSTSEAGFPRTTHFVYYSQEQIYYLENNYGINIKPESTRTPENEPEIFAYVQATNNTETAGSFLEAAEIVHSRYEREKWTYSLSGLYYRNIKKSMAHPKKITCCATFVGEVLYVSGLLTEDEVNSFNYNSSTATYKYLLTLEGRFVEVKNYEDLQAGDIVYMYNETPGKIEHTQIYAGNQTWYNAGTKSAIQREDSPYKSTKSPKQKFITAVRPLKGGSTNE